MFGLLAAICVIALLGVPLKQWLGFKKFCQLLCNSALFALLSARAMMLLSRAPYPKLAPVDLASLLAGIVFSLAITGGDKPDETFRPHPVAATLSTALLLRVYADIFLSGRSDPFLFLYAMGVGVFGGFYFSWQNQNATNRNVFDKTRVLPPRQKAKWKQMPGTLCVLAAMAAVSLAGAATVSLRHLLDLYGGTGLGAWFRYLFLHIFQWDQNRLAFLTNVSMQTLGKGQLWRPFTVSLLHFGPLHLFGNGLAMYFTGKYMEPRVGTLRWLGVFFGSVWSSLLTFLSVYPNFGGGGASIGTYALVTIFLLQSFAKGNKIRSRPYEMFYLMGYVFVGNFISFGFMHFVSFVFGLAAAYVLVRRSANREQPISGH